MRVFLIALTVACGAGPHVAPAPAREVPRAQVKPPPPAREPVDAIATLAQPQLESSWVVAGPAQLVPGGMTLEPIDDTQPLEVDLLDERGSEVRVGVRLERVRFAVWMARTRVLGVVAREQQISFHPTREHVALDSPLRLRAGARVAPLAHKHGWTQVRYAGVLEIEGWIPDEAVVDRGPAGRKVARRPAPHARPRMFVRGTAIRAEPRSLTRVLAVVRHSSFVDVLRILDDDWLEVSYEDGDVYVHGFASKREPPLALPRSRDSEPIMASVAESAEHTTVAAGTCLFAEGEPVGLVVSDAPAVLERASRVGLFTVTLDTPWGPVAFEARGTLETELATCETASP